MKKIPGWSRGNRGKPGFSVFFHNLTFRRIFAGALPMANFAKAGKKFCA